MSYQYLISFTVEGKGSLQKIVHHSHIFGVNDELSAVEFVNWLFFLFVTAVVCEQMLQAEHLFFYWKT